MSVVDPRKQRGFASVEACFLLPLILVMWLFAVAFWRAGATKIDNIGEARLQAWRSAAGAPPLLPWPLSASGQEAAATDNLVSLMREAGTSRYKRIDELTEVIQEKEGDSWFAQVRTEFPGFPLSWEPVKATDLHVVTIFPVWTGNQNEEMPVGYDPYLKWRLYCRNKVKYYSVKPVLFPGFFPVAKSARLQGKQPCG